MFPQWLTQKLTVEEAEEQFAVTDKRLGPEPVPFGFLNDKWQELLAGMEEGDEIWAFCSPPDTWENMMGRAGVCLVRDGMPVVVITTRLN